MEKITIKEKNLLKNKLTIILNKFDKIEVYKIKLTLKECNIWPNIEMFFTKNDYNWSERIFLTEWKNEFWEIELFKALNTCKNIRDLMSINTRTKHDLKGIAQNINY